MNILSPSVSTVLCLGLVTAFASESSTADAKPEFDRYIISDVAEKVTPAVVNITTRRSGKAPDGLPQTFREFFGRRVPPQMGVGSGVIISSDGEIVTNNHVVDKADEITVTLSDKREFKAKVIGVDKPSDLAFLRIKAKDLPYLEFGDSASLRLGEFVLAVGNPFGVGQTVTMGIVSAKGRANMGIVDYEDFIQTDAAIHPGNSGGALVDLAGKLVGINTAILSRTGAGQGVGFAVPSAMVRPIRNQIADNGRVRRGWLGVAIQDLTPDLARSLELDQVRGVLVSDVFDGGPADKAKITAGDVVVSVDGRPTKTMAQLRNRIALTSPGSQTSLSIIRNGKKRTVTVTLDEKEEEGVIAQLETESDGILRGMNVEELNRSIRSELKIPGDVQGVVVTRVEPGSPADRAGIELGNVITSVNRNPVSNAKSFAEAIPEDASRVLFQLYRRGFSTFVVVRR